MIRQAMPLRWIEQAEARQVITAARFERSPGAERRSALAEAAAAWLARARAWLVFDLSCGCPVGQPQLVPVRVRRRQSGPVGHSEDAGRGYWH